MNADKVMFEAISHYAKMKLREMKDWYFGGLAPRYITIPVFLFAVMVALSILAFVPPTIAGLYAMGGLFLLVLGVGPALLILLGFMALTYLTLPIRIWNWSQRRMTAGWLRMTAVVGGMLAGWLVVGFLQLGYGYIIQSGLGL